MRLQVLTCFVLLCVVVFTAIQLTETAAAQGDLTCVENPTGEVSLNVAVRGVPGPEGPPGIKGEVGPLGVKGEQGHRGLKGLKGDRGDIGGVGKTGSKGEIGTKGQKGSRGIPGNPGPVGTPGLVGPRGSSLRGYPGAEGPVGPRGPAGLPGPRGPQGQEGDTVLSNEELNRVSAQIQASVDNTLENAIKAFASTVQELNKTMHENIIPDLQAIKQLSADKDYCGIQGPWRRVAYLNTISNASCPSGLRSVTNATTGQRACGRSSNSLGCNLWQVPSKGQYTNVCGRARAYQFYHAVAFWGYHYSGHRQTSLNSAYVDGISITSENVQRHIWTFAAGGAADRIPDARCPCAIQPPQSSPPSFVGSHYFCESGYGARLQGRVAWENPLWDGVGCNGETNVCCGRSGWFHRQLPASTDDIQIRWCGATGGLNSDVPTDLLEIWVM